MRARWVWLLVLGLAIVVGCKRKPANTAPAPDNPAPAPGDPGAPGAGQATAKNGRGTFTIGKATTHVTGPRDANGHIDYAAALNERLKKGVTPENNANVLFWKALGPSPVVNQQAPPAFFEALGVAAPSASGDYFVGLRQYAQRNPNVGSAEAAFDAMKRCGERPWLANTQPGISGWLKANEKPLALVVEGTKRTHYFSPLVLDRNDRGSTGFINARLPGPQACRELASALTARAMLSTANGQADAAWQDLLACHRLGRLVARGPTLIEELVGIAIDLLASRADVAFLAHTQPDAKRLDGYLRDLAELAPLPDVAEKVDLAERFQCLDSIMLLDRQGLGFFRGMDAEGRLPHHIDETMLGGIDWDPALESANRWFDRLAAALREKDRAKRLVELGKVEAELRELKIQATGMARFQQFLNEGVEPGKAKGRAVGEILTWLLVPAAWKVQDASDRAAQSLENVAVAFALLRQARDTDRYPATLEPVAKYLGRAPVDVFSGTTPIYKPTADGYLLYSVGPNGRDDGGRTQDDQPPGDDIVVRMPPR
jgi:hypothetical protein